MVARFRADTALLVPDMETVLLGLAVSGGPDSLALLLLAHRAFPGRVHAATVDHGLRPEAAGEARFVAELCARLDVPHRTLQPTAPITGNLQSAARSARYALLDQWRAESQLEMLATAHHADDQAETVMMRLLRGSGVAGLAAIRSATRLPSGLRVIRPLLSWRRSELASVVAEAGIVAVDDPSNRDLRFDRVRMRERLQAAPWIEPRALARSAAALAEAENALEWAAATAWETHVTVLAGAVTIRPDALPREVLRRLVLRAIGRFCDGAPPRGEPLQAVLHALAEGEVRTLANVKCSGGSLWIFTPAPPRRGN